MIDPTPKIAVYMSEEETRRFIAFQKHYAFIQALDKIGVFDLKSGSIEIHFDHMGQIGRVAVHKNFTP